MKLKNGTPEEAGIRPRTAKLIKERAQEWSSAGSTPALVLTATRNGVVFLNEAYGHFGPGEKAAPLTSDAIFPLASMSKPIVATAIMILVEEGNLSFPDVGPVAWPELGQFDRLLGTAGGGQ